MKNYKKNNLKNQFRSILNEKGKKAHFTYKI